MICHWATNRTDPQNLLSMTLNVPLQLLYSSCMLGGLDTQRQLNPKLGDCPRSKVIFEWGCQGRAEREWSDPEWSRVTPEWKGVDNKMGEQPWPQLVRCASIYCRVCGCVFQEDWIVVRSLREEWYRLIKVRIGQGEDVNDFNLWTKELGCNYWSTYTKSGIGGVQVTSLHRDPIGVDNRSLGAKN